MPSTLPFFLRSWRPLAGAAATLAAALCSTAATAACYVVYGPDQQVVYRAPEPPMDLSRDLHDTLPAVAPGGTLVFTLDDFGCALQVHKLPLSPAPQGQPAASPTRRGDGS